MIIILNVKDIGEDVEFFVFEVIICWFVILNKFFDRDEFNIKFNFFWFLLCYGLLKKRI